MTYVVNTGVAPFCHSQDRPGRVAVPSIGVAAVLASEGSFGELQPLLGSREADGARHRRVGGHDDHHLTSGPHGTLDQFSLRRADRGIGRLSCHRGLGQESRFEVLDSDQLMVRDNTFGPDSGSMSVLSLSLLVELGGMSARYLVTLRRGAVTRSTSTGHAPLLFCQLSRTSAPVAAERQIVGRIRRSRCGGHTPVDTDAAASGVRLLSGLSADNERRIPVSDAVPVHTDRSRFGREFARPDDRDTHAFRQSQSTISDRESVAGVSQGRQRLRTLLDPGPIAFFDLERLVERSRVGVQRAGLSILRPSPQPSVRRARRSQQLPQLRLGGLASGLLLMNRLVPQVATAIPFVDKGTLRGHARAQAVGVARDLFHDPKLPAQGGIL